MVVEMLPKKEWGKDLKFIRALAVLVIIISRLIILLNCLLHYIAGFVRDSKKILIPIMLIALLVFLLW